MKTYMGFDIGGTKIAGAVLDEDGNEISSCHLPTPKTYPAFLEACADAIQQLESESHHRGPVGISMPGVIDEEAGTAHCANLPIKGESVRDDLVHKTGRNVKIANDANCMALAEYTQGAGKGKKSLFGLIIGTGVGGGYVYKGDAISGFNGITGEIGHLPLPFCEAGDIVLTEKCYCKQMNCVEQALRASALEKRYELIAGKAKNTFEIVADARENEPMALKTLDQYYELIAKAMTTIMHAYDPQIIVIAGGLNDLPGLYEEVPKRVPSYALYGTRLPEVKHAAFGPESGLRGAACLWR